MNEWKVIFPVVDSSAKTRQKKTRLEASHSMNQQCKYWKTQRQVQQINVSKDIAQGKEKEIVLHLVRRQKKYVNKKKGKMKSEKRQDGHFPHHLFPQACL